MANAELMSALVKYLPEDAKAALLEAELRAGIELSAVDIRGRDRQMPPIAGRVRLSSRENIQARWVGEDWGFGMGRPSRHRMEVEIDLSQDAQLVFTPEGRRAPLSLPMAALPGGPLFVDGDALSELGLRFVDDAHQALEQLAREANLLRDALPALRAASQRQHELGLGDVRDSCVQYESLAQLRHDQAQLAVHFPLVRRDAISRWELLREREDWRPSTLPRVISARLHDELSHIVLTSSTATVRNHLAEFRQYLLDSHLREISWPGDLRWLAALPHIPPIALERADFVRSRCSAQTVFDLVWAAKFEAQQSVPQDRDPALLAEAGDLSFLLAIWGGDRHVIEEYLVPS